MVKAAGEGPCEPCAAGRKATGFRQATCEECAASEFCPRGSGCPAGKYSTSTSEGCEFECVDSSTISDNTRTCDAGSYCPDVLRDEGGTWLGAPEFEQRPCPAGCVCVKNVKNPQKCPPNTYQEKTASAVVTDCRPCTVASHCAAGICAHGYTGKGCNECWTKRDFNLAFYKMNGDCHECPTIPTGLIAMGFLCLLALYAFVKADLNNWESLAALQLMANYLQNINITRLMFVSWPAIYDEIMDIIKKLTLFDLEVATPECMDVTYNWHVRYFGNVGAYAGAAIVLGFLLRRQTKRNASGSDESVGQKTKVKLQRLLVVTFTFGYEAVTKVCLRSFQPSFDVGGACSTSANQECTTSSDCPSTESCILSRDDVVFMHDPTILFYSKTHIFVMAFSGVLMVFASYGGPVLLYHFCKWLLHADPKAPRHARPTYIYFCMERRPHLQGSTNENAKLMWAEWATLKDTSTYDSLAHKDKARFQKEQAAYVNGQKAGKRARRCGSRDQFFRWLLNDTKHYPKGRVDEEKYTLAYGALFDTYEPTYIYFQVFVILRKGLEIMAVVLLRPYVPATDPTHDRMFYVYTLAQAGAQILISVVYFAFLYKWRPFKEKITKCFCGVKVDVFNDLEMLVTVLLVVNKATALVFTLACGMKIELPNGEKVCYYMAPDYSNGTAYSNETTIAREIKTRSDVTLSSWSISWWAGTVASFNMLVACILIANVVKRFGWKDLVAADAAHELAVDAGLLEKRRVRRPVDHSTQSNVNNINKLGHEISKHAEAGEYDDAKDKKNKYRRLVRGSVRTSMDRKEGRANTLLHGLAFKSGGTKYDPCWDETELELEHEYDQLDFHQSLTERRKQRRLLNAALKEYHKTYTKKLKPDKVNKVWGTDQELWYTSKLYGRGEINFNTDRSRNSRKIETKHQQERMDATKIYVKNSKRLEMIASINACLSSRKTLPPCYWRGDRRGTWRDGGPTSDLARHYR